jgi:phosphoglycolate phosphatase-like HAD superfamily hydrolase
VTNSQNFNLSSYELVFWDFDGVIKDSLKIKADAYVQIFSEYRLEDLTRQILFHHESNPGISRFEKIPLYMDWIGINLDETSKNAFIKRYGELVKTAVVSSEWVPGSQEYLLSHCRRQYFVLLTATPQAEIEEIVSLLNIRHCFKEIYGAPFNKASVIREVLSRKECPPTKALMIGDTMGDLMAAEDNLVQFVLRRTSLNYSIQAIYKGHKIDNFHNE